MERPGANRRAVRFSIALLHPNVEPGKPNSRTMKVTAEEFREEILRQIKEGNGESHEIRAGDVVRDLGDRLRRRGENANCCGAMRTLFRPGDRIIRLPKKKDRTPPPKRNPVDGNTFDQQTNGENHQGANLIIHYKRSTDRTQPA